MNWYYADATRQQKGPLDDAGLEALAAAGAITPETLVWREGMANWQMLREVKPSLATSTVSSASGTGEAVCAECGGLFPIDDTISVGNNRVCANCKPVFVQKMREGVSVEKAGALQYAGFWIRFCAYFLDVILLTIVNQSINLIFGLGFAGMGRRVEPGSGFMLLTFGVIFFELFIGVAYETFMVGRYGATVGKMACRLRVVTPEGAIVSYPRALGRYFAKMVSSFTCLIGFIMAGFDPEKRALHDRIASTRVVYK